MSLETPEPEKGLLKVPQVGETGISHDYYNVFMPFVQSWIIENESGKGAGFHQHVQQHLKPLLHYQKRFPIESYSNVVTEKNRASLEDLDAVIDTVNQQAREGTLTEETFCALHNRAVDCIYGEKGGTYLRPNGKLETKTEHTQTTTTIDTDHGP